MASQIYAMFMSAASDFEVQRTNNFRIIFDSNLDPNQYIELACTSTGLPSVETEPLTLSYGNSDVKVAGKATVGDISVTVKDFIEPDLEKVLWDWRQKVYNTETGKVGWAVNYKKNVTIVQYGPNGEVNRKWQCFGVWPTSLDLGELSNEGSDVKSITMNLSVDNATLVRDGSTIANDYTTEGQFT